MCWIEGRKGRGARGAAPAPRTAADATTLAPRGPRGVSAAQACTAWAVLADKPRLRQLVVELGSRKQTAHNLDRTKNRPESFQY
jgi:hypothetical protein